MQLFMRAYRLRDGLAFQKICTLLLTYFIGPHRPKYSIQSFMFGFIRSILNVYEQTKYTFDS